MYGEGKSRVLGAIVLSGGARISVVPMPKFLASGSHHAVACKGDRCHPPPALLPPNKPLGVIQ